MNFFKSFAGLFGGGEIFFGVWGCYDREVAVEGGFDLGVEMVAVG